MCYRTPRRLRTTALFVRNADRPPVLVCRVTSSTDTKHMWRNTRPLRCKLARTPLRARVVAVLFFPAAIILSAQGALPPSLPPSHSLSFSLLLPFLFSLPSPRIAVITLPRRCCYSPSPPLPNPLLTLCSRSDVRRGITEAKVAKGRRNGQKSSTLVAEFRVV